VRAAESLYLSQPSLSRNMKKLEELLGVPLFERGRNQIKLNQTGRIAADHARRILQQHEAMVAHVRAFDKSLHTVSIGSCAPGPLMALAPRATAAFADMTITSDIRPEAELIAGLTDATYKFVILRRDPHLPQNNNEEGEAVSLPADTHAEKLMEEHLYLSVPVMHPAASCKHVAFSDMDGSGFIMYSQVGFWEDVVRAAMPNAKFYLQADMDAVGELTRYSDLPSFTSDITQGLLPSQSNGRINVPFSDAEAHATYWLCSQDATMLKKLIG
jgi:DNA-binding transcriptional LysR family regulator